MINEDIKPRILRSVPAPLGLYLRPGFNDHKALSERIASGGTSFSGVVLSAGRGERHEELRADARTHGLEAVLDPHIVELATPVGFAQYQALPWAGDAMHTVASLGRGQGAVIAADLASYAVQHQFDAVLAPTHYIGGTSDPWLSIDARATVELRRRLDEAGAGETRIYYPLSLSQRAFSDDEQREQIRHTLKQLPIDALWLRVHPFGSSCSGAALKRYIDACLDLQQLHVPLVAERTGTVGLPLLAFGAVGGIECGITFGERFDFQSLMRPRDKDKGFSRPSRVYIERLGVFLEPDQAEAFFAAKGTKAFFACQDPDCCRDGARSTVKDARRHFLNARMKEVRRVGSAPDPLRAGQYLEEFLRPASDLILKATKVEVGFDFRKQQRRLEQWRETLGVMHIDGMGRTKAMVPSGRRVGRRAVSF